MRVEIYARIVLVSLPHAITAGYIKFSTNMREQITATNHARYRVCYVRYRVRYVRRKGPVNKCCYNYSVIDFFEYVSYLFLQGPCNVPKITSCRLS